MAPGLTRGVNYHFAVTAVDLDGNESWYSKEATVLLNETPDLSYIDDITIKEDEKAIVVLSATDSEGDLITFEAAASANEVKTSLVSDTLTLTPDLNWNGATKVVVKANDGFSKDTKEFKLTVLPVNDTPTSFTWSST